MEINLRRLAIAQIVLGVLVVGSFFAFVNWVAHGYYVYQGMVPGSDIIVRMHVNPGQATIFETWQLVYLALGLVVIICGIAQLVKARR